MTVIIDGIEYLPASAAAEQLATTETKILMLLKQKALTGELVEGEWFVTAASLAGFDAHACEQEKQAQCRTGCGTGSTGCGCH